MTCLISVSCSKNENESQNKSEIPQETDPHSGNMPSQNGLNELVDNNKLSDEELNSPTVQISGIELTTPDTWQRETPSSSMRALQYALKSDKSLKVAGFFFGTQDLASDNIKRWKGEFTKLTNDKEEKLNNNITYLILEGTYNIKPFPMAEEGTPTDNYMVLASIVPTPEGPYYFKIYGPKEKLSKEVESFRKFLNSYKKIS